MKTLQFKCKLLTDVVLNQRAATEGNQECLDFIPGSNFLGIAAGTLYKDESVESLTIFHSGKVRFGDAHPMKADKRALRVPAAMFQPKSKEDRTVFLHHEIKDFDKLEDLQLKQCRKGFYVFAEDKGEEVEVEKSFAIKSAYDREMRRSKDKQMYGYESLQAGSEWLFEVSINDDLNVEKEITDALTGTQRIGRSRTAQYGLVKIDVAKPFQTESPTVITDHAVVYADARLIFLDEYGLPTLQPIATKLTDRSCRSLQELPTLQPIVTDLGFLGGEIDWSKSQIRTFQYAPWNFKRQARDADRCGIEKGSVIYVQKSEKAEKLEYTGNGWVGVYQNEGFGKIIINPEFLKASGNNGEALFQLEKAEKSDPESNGTTSSDPLFIYLKKQQEQVETERDILRLVNEFVEENRIDFTKESFASQWGSIRNIAMQYHSKDKIILELFDKKETNSKGKEVPSAYLTHGVAKDKWEERGRKDKFKKFIDEKLQEIPNIYFRFAIINLASEMAKISKK
jgi:hypothetical protein